MKKQNLLKLALVTVAMLLFVGANAQNPADFDDAALDGDISYVTVGKTMPFYVVPDNNYHPTWTPFSNNLTSGFTWTWTSTAFGTDLTLATQTDNYVTITANNIGSYLVNVKEAAPAAWGGCEDPTGTDITINVVAAPTIGGFPYFTGLGASPYLVCAPFTANPNIQITGFPNFEVIVSLSSQEIDFSGTLQGSATLILDEEAVVVGGGNSLTSGTGTYIFDADRVLDILGGHQRTQYVYTVHGVTDLVSRKSDYLSTQTLYGAGTTYTIIVNPAPTTGPIFHIPNDFGNL